jgi:hypothetical protein
VPFWKISDLVNCVVERTPKSIHGIAGCSIAESSDHLLQRAEEVQARPADDLCEELLGRDFAERSAFYISKKFTHGFAIAPSTNGLGRKQCASKACY